MATISIKDEMQAFDRKDRTFYDALTDEDRKKFSPYLMIRWGASVTGSADLQAYYLLSTNEKLNKNFFSINKDHNKLNWLAATTVSPDMGDQYHQWIKGPTLNGASSKVQAFIQKLYPEAKLSDLMLLEKLTELSYWKEVARDLGMPPEQVKKELG